MTNKFAKEEGCRIVRQHNVRIGDIASLYNQHGDYLYSFPGNFTDDQIMKALDFANFSFTRGVALGRFLQDQQLPD